jgi:hypothetical protein
VRSRGKLSEDFGWSAKDTSKPITPQKNYRIIWPECNRPHTKACCLERMSLEVVASERRKKNKSGVEDRGGGGGGGGGEEENREIEGRRERARVHPLLLSGTLS